MNILHRRFTILVLSIVAMFACAGCTPPEPIPNGVQPPAGATGSPDKSSAGSARGSETRSNVNSPFRLDENGLERIVVGSFNIQSLGRAKIAKPDVTKVLVDIIRSFDIIAIQELRDVNQETIPKLMEMINEGDFAFRAIVGPRQGYIVNTGRSYFEQAVYIYDSNTIEPVGQSYVADDPTKAMHRAPFVSRFRCLLNNQYQPFSFTLLNVHVDPDEIATELPALVGITRGTFLNHDEDDFIVLGDLNATPRQIQTYPWLENQISLIEKGTPTNTAKSRTIDNIVLDRRRSAEFSQQSGVIDLHQQYGLTHEAAVAVSDHMPVWATFSPYEADPKALSRPPSHLPPPGGGGTLERTSRLPTQTDRRSNETAR